MQTHMLGKYTISILPSHMLGKYIITVMVSHMLGKSFEYCQNNNKALFRKIYILHIHVMFIRNIINFLTAWALYILILLVLQN